jgi:glutathione S-transferase
LENAPAIIPTDPRVAIEARQMDSVFDDYVMAPLSRMVLNALREESKRDPYAVAEARATLDKSYAWLNRWMTGREWAANNAFSIADCAAAPAVLRSLDLPDLRISHRASRLSIAPARSSDNRTHRRRGATVAGKYSAQGECSGLTWR